MMKTKSQLKEYRHIPLSNPTLMVGWQTQDVGNVGTGVISFLQQNCGGEETAEIDPLGFFAFEGAIFKEDLIQIPQSKFWASTESNLLLFSSDEPMYGKYDFLNTILDYCQERHQISRLYSFNGNPSYTTHTKRRRLLLVCNRESFRDDFPENSNLEHASWEGPPAMSTYLLWMAQKKGIAGATLWVEVPFYLATQEDPLAIKSILNLLDPRANLNLDLAALDQKISRQHRLLRELSESDPEVCSTLEKLEGGDEDSLDENEQMALTKKVYEYLRKRA